MNRILIYGVLLIFWIDGICLAEELKPAEGAIILNLLRQSIKSGELRVIYVETKFHSEKAKENIENEIARADWQIPSQSKSEIHAYLRKGKRVIQEEQTIFWQVNAGSSELEINYYKYIGSDRKPIYPLSDIGRFIHGGYFKITTFNGEFAAQERESPLGSTSIRLDNMLTEEIPSFHLFGRSLKYIPPDAQVNLTQKTVNGESLYEVQFPIEINTGFNTVDRVCRLLTNPSEGFIVLKEEHFVDGNIVFSVDYEEFHIESSISYPTEIDMKWYNNVTGLYKQVKFTVKGMIFNVEFPHDFFQVERRFHPNQEFDSISTITPDTDVSRQKQPVHQTAPLPMCGPLSLQFVFERFKVKTDINELLVLTDFKEDIGTSMMGLYNAAWQKKLNPEGILIQSKSLADIKLPAIAHVDKNHFIVVTGVSNKEINIFDPASDQKVISIKEFQNRWTGNLLTFSPPIESAPSISIPTLTKIKDEPSQIQISQTTYDFGRIRGGQLVEHIFTVTNLGRIPVEISQTESSCGCTTVFLANPIIRPGKTLPLKVQLHAPQKEESTEQFVRFQTNTPAQPGFELKVKATIYLPLRVTPSRLYLGKVSSNAPVTRILDMEYSAEFVKILGFRTSSKVVEANLLNDERRLAIRVNPQINGVINEKIFIDFLDRDEKLVQEIPVGGEVTGDFEISSKNIFFGLVNANMKGGKLSQELIITAKRPSLSILRAESQSNHVLTEILPFEENGKYKIKISLHSIGNTRGLLKEVVNIYTNSPSQEKLEIPIYAQITIAE